MNIGLDIRSRNDYFFTRTLNSYEICGVESYMKHIVIYLIKLNKNIKT